MKGVELAIDRCFYRTTRGVCGQGAPLSSHRVPMHDAFFPSRVDNTHVVFAIDLLRLVQSVCSDAFPTWKVLRVCSYCGRLCPFERMTLFPDLEEKPADDAGEDEPADGGAAG